MNYYKNGKVYLAALYWQKTS